MQEKHPRTVHITNYYHKNSGGISTSYNNLLAAAERWKREVRLIVPGETESIEIVNDFAKIYYVPAKYSPVFDKRYRIILPWQYMPSDSIIRRILMDEMPDLIEVTDKYTLSMLGAMIRIGKFKQLNRPILVHFSCERMDDNVASFLSGGRIAKWFARRIIGNYTLPSFDYHIANSTYTADEIYKSGLASNDAKRSKWLFNKTWRALRAPRVPLEDRVIVCPRGVDAEMFTPEKRADVTRQELVELAGVPENATLLLYAGRISPEKNIGLLVEMMRQLVADNDKDFRLIIAGAGPLDEWLTSETDKYFPGKIIQVGHVDKETLAGFYANADVFVHPNPKEPFGIAPLEAMASGVATVAPNAGGILSYATNDNAWLVEPTGEAFAAAVREVVGDAALREKKVAAAIATARKNTRQASTDRLFETYDMIYKDFHSKRELFTDIDASRIFDHAEMNK